MKVTYTQEALARRLGIVGRAVASRSALPITSNVLISSVEGSLRLSARGNEESRRRSPPSRKLWRQIVSLAGL